MNTALRDIAKRVDDLGETVTMAKDPVDGSTIAVLDWEAVGRILDKLQRPVIDRELLARTIIARVEGIAAEGKATPYVREVPTGLDYGKHWPIMVAIETMSTVDLDGATNEPAPERRVASAGEFAALWNVKTPQQREDLVVQLLHQQDTTSRCFQEDHEGLKGQIANLQGLVTAQAAKLEKLQEYAEDRGRHMKHPSLNTVGSGRVASDLFDILGVKSRPDSWVLEYGHSDCAECEACAELAIERLQEFPSLIRSHSSSGNGDGHWGRAERSR